MIDIVALMDNVESIDGGHIKSWCDEDPARFTLLREALMDKDSKMYQDFKYDQHPLNIFHHYEAEKDPYWYENYEDYAIENMEYSWMINSGYVSIEAKTFKKWYYNIWSPDESVEPHMSEALKMAVQCSRELYSSEDLAEESGTVQNKKIVKWLKGNYPNWCGVNKTNAFKCLVTHYNTNRSA